MRYSIKPRKTNMLMVMNFYLLLKILVKIAEVNMDKSFFINQKNMLLILLRILQKERLKKQQKQQLIRLAKISADKINQKNKNFANTNKLSKAKDSEFGTKKQNCPEKDTNHQKKTTFTDEL